MSLSELMAQVVDINIRTGPIGGIASPVTLETTATSVALVICHPGLHASRISQTDEICEIGYSIQEPSVNLN